MARTRAPPEVLHDELTQERLIGMTLFVDVWEGSLEIQEDELEGFVAGFMIRLNDIQGGHHKDQNFDNQWAQAADITPDTHPWLFHRVYGSSNNPTGYSVLNHVYTIPLIAAGGLPWYIPLASLTKA
jgi:hypothetical protein